MHLKQSLLHTFMLLTITSLASSLQHEFIRSFILRPWMLSNATVPEPSVQRGPVTLSLYVDNWSPNSLVLASDRLNEGVWEPNLEPRNMGPKRRDLLFRTVSSSSSSASARTSGVVGWTITDGLNPLSRFTIAWDVGNGGKASKFSAALGSFVPTGEEMWMPVPKMISKGLAAIQSSSQLDDTVYLLQPKVVLAAINMTMRDGEGLHYRLFVSIVPPNIDVWGWIKYFREKTDQVESKGTKEKEDASKDSLPKSGIKMKVKMIPEVSQKSDVNVEVTQQSKSAMHRDETSTTTLTSTTSETTTSTTTSTSTLSTQKAIFHGIPVDEEPPLHHQKHLLIKGPAYSKLDDKELSLRGTLATLSESIAVAIHIENWSRFPLSLGHLNIVSGKMDQEYESLTPPPPGKVEPGRLDFGVVLQSAPLTGTSGVVRWSIGDMDRVLSVMWSVPYNRQLWRTWISVGLTSHGADLPTYDDLYSGHNSEGRFLRQQAGHQFEFSDGQFIIVAQMDGDATFKPVLRIVLAPIPSEWLANSVRKQLGMKIIPDNAVSVDLSKKTQKRQESPTVGHVVSTNAGLKLEAGSIQFLPLSVLTLWIILSCK